MTRYSSATLASNPTDRPVRTTFAGIRSWRLSGQWVALGLILAFVATRGLLGALVNPPFNGPDERGHVLEIATVLQLDVSDEDRVSQRQPRPYYLAAALAIRLLGIPIDPEHLDWQALIPLRLVSVLLGTLTTATTYVTARYALRGDPAAAPTLALAAALVAGLAPIHQFTMASVANDPSGNCTGGVKHGSSRCHHRPRLVTLLRPRAGWRCARRGRNQGNELGSGRRRRLAIGRGPAATAASDPPGRRHR